MLRSICHERFYETGFWQDQALGICVGWTTLGGVAAQRQPILDEEGDISLILSGECYGDRPIDAVAITSNKSGNSDGSAGSDGFLPAVAENLAELNGVFHGVVVDRKLGQVLLFNDRYGMHRLFYHESEDAFYFGSEAKAILAVRPELRALDERSVGEFVACGCVLDNRTIFKHIYSFPAASSWLFNYGELTRKGTYFDPHVWEEQAVLTGQEFYVQLRKTVRDSLPHYFSSDARAGVAMTGGLDTRVIVACHQAAPGAMPTYTFGSTLRETHDVRIAREVASVLEQTHQVIQAGDEFIANFPAYAQRCVYLTEGTVDVSRASDLYMSQKARDICPVKVVGTYGSEILRRAVMFKPVEPHPNLFVPEFVAEVSKSRGTYAVLRQKHPVTFAAFVQSPWYHHGILALEQSQLTVRSPFLDKEFVRVAYLSPDQTGTGEDYRLRLVADANPALARIPSDRGLRMHMSPLNHLVHRIREFSFKAEYAYDYGMPQNVARVDHALSWLHLERLFLGRHKLLHFRTWYKEQLADYVRQMLLDPLTLRRSYLNKQTVERIVGAHIAGTYNYTTAIHKLLTLEIMQREFFEL